MRSLRPKSSFRLVLAAWCMGLVMAAGGTSSATAQARSTNTPPPGGVAPYVTNTFEGEPEINVRTGPSTIAYPLRCGSLAFGATAPALGTSRGHEWIEIAFQECPGGVGWIYAANVVLTGGPLRVVEPPSTPTPLVTPTIDDTLLAAFHIESTQTRLPTFTPPPSLEPPTFPAASAGRYGVPAGLTILVIGLVGGVFLAASFAGRRREQ